MKTATLTFVTDVNGEGKRVKFLTPCKGNKKEVYNIIGELADFDFCVPERYVQLAILELIEYGYSVNIK